MATSSGKKSRSVTEWPKEDITQSVSSASGIRLTDEDLKFALAELRQHNKYRKAHGAPKLKISMKLTQYAKEWATQLCRSGSMRHRSERNFGENIFMKYGSGGSSGKPEEACNSWYDEIRHYRNWNCETNCFDMNTGHFTQVVWVGTKYLGVAKVTVGNGMQFVVANYHPAGNFMGQFTKNVRPPIKSISAVSSSSESSDEEEKTAAPKKAAEKKKAEVAEKAVEGKAKAKSAVTKKGKQVGNDGWPMEDIDVSVNSVQLTPDDLGFMKAQLSRHNRYRKAHGAPKLKMSKKLSQVAKEWGMKLAREGCLRHRTGGKFGENLFMKCDPHGIGGSDPGQACDDWYKEIRMFRSWNNDNAFSGSTGHFTQVVWVGSQYLGVARVRGSGGQEYVVANYYPPGNMMGSFARNVRPPIKQPSEVSSSSESEVSQESSESEDEEEQPKKEVQPKMELTKEVQPKKKTKEGALARSFHAVTLETSQSGGRESRIESRTESMFRSHSSTSQRVTYQSSTVVSSGLHVADFSHAGNLTDFFAKNVQLRPIQDGQEDTSSESDDN